MPLYVRRYLGSRTTLLFTVLLAISPVLIQYSRMARPYALTLLLSLCALAAFKRFVEADRQAWKPALVYLLCAVSCSLVAPDYLAVGGGAISDHRCGCNIQPRLGPGGAHLLAWAGNFGRIAIACIAAVVESPAGLDGQAGCRNPDLADLLRGPVCLVGYVFASRGDHRSGAGCHGSRNPVARDPVDTYVAGWPGADLI